MKHALLRTLAGRAILIGVATRLVDFLVGLSLGTLPTPLAILDVIAAILIAAGGVYFLVHAVAAMNRRFLWRVRRKLILSYIFIGFVPSILVVAFFLLGGVLLFLNFSAFMVRTEFRAITERARAIAHTVALETERASGRDVSGLLRRQQVQLATEFPGISLALVGAERRCAGSASLALPAATRPTVPVAVTGPWTHVDPPTEIPPWVPCEGFTGLFVYSREPVSAETSNLLVRSVAFPESTNPGYAVVVDLAADRLFKRKLRETIGVDLGRISLLSRNAPDKNIVTPLTGKPGGADESGDTGADSPPLTSITYLEYRDWVTGAADTLVVSIRLGLGEIYSRISSAPGADGTGNIVILILELVGGLFLVMEIVALAMGLALARSITGSVHELFTGTEQVRRGDFTHKIEVKADDQLGELAESFNSMTASIEDLLQQAAEKKRLEEELRIAHEIQMSLLPQGPLHMPGVSVTAVCVPAREVGGDYYDFFPLDAHRLGVLIADVSGKGTSAALYMAELKGLMLSLSRVHSSPRALLIEANRIIAPHLDARSFITLTYAIVDLKARTMTYARAGHTPLIHLPPSRAREPRRARILAPSGMVLGLKLDHGEMFERLLEEAWIPLQSGDLYVFFTDGITEAMTRLDDFFGEHRLGQIIERHADLPSEELRERVFREIESFVGDAPQHDDMTMILLRIEDDTRQGVFAAEEAEMVETV
jgi:sigma-B regulation protein RsbU (phosphoserine phosphatase)